tara:strand:+ start:607 stop:855 length:249 start_codon:yes stop_codon:yes gene_type:complete
VPRSTDDRIHRTPPQPKQQRIANVMRLRHGRRKSKDAGAPHPRNERIRSDQVRNQRRSEGAHQIRKRHNQLVLLQIRNMRQY